MIKMESDLHLHTIASGHGYSTIKENIEEARKRGLKTIAITDHGLNMPGAPPVCYFTNMISLPQTMQGVEVLRGVEAIRNPYVHIITHPDNPIYPIDAETVFI